MRELIVNTSFSSGISFPIRHFGKGAIMSPCHDVRTSNFAFAGTEIDNIDNYLRRNVGNLNVVLERSYSFVWPWC